jgi:uncharacterized membrane protein YgaE (UPF0421/DUF939 family)
MVNEFTAIRQQAASQAQTISQTITQLGTDSTALKSQIESLNQTIAVLATEIAYDDEGNPYNPNTEAIAQLAAQIDAVTDQIESVFQQINEAKNQLAQMQNEEAKAALEEQLKEIENQLKEQTEQLAESLGIDPKNIDYNAEGLGVFTGLEILDDEQVPEKIENLGTVMKTSGGYYISTDAEAGGSTTLIYDEEGNVLNRINADRSIDEGGDGNPDFFFADDSYFILPDGTEILLNTGNRADGTNSLGLIVRDGSQEATVGIGLDDTTQMTTEVKYTGVDNTGKFAELGRDELGAGVFAWSDAANGGQGGWAVKQNDKFFDVTNENIDQFLANKSFTGQSTGNALEIEFQDNKIEKFLNNIERISGNLLDLSKMMEDFNANLEEAVKEEEKAQEAEKAKNEQAAKEAAAAKRLDDMKKKKEDEANDAEVQKEKAAAESLKNFEDTKNKMNDPNAKVEDILKAYKENYRDFDKHIEKEDEAVKQALIRNLISKAEGIQARDDLSSAEKQDMLGELLFIVDRIPVDNPPDLGVFGVVAETEVESGPQGFIDRLQTPLENPEELIEAYQNDYRSIDDFVQEKFTQEDIQNNILPAFDNLIQEYGNQGELVENLNFIRNRFAGF